MEWLDAFGSPTQGAQSSYVTAVPTTVSTVTNLMSRKSEIRTAQLFSDHLANSHAFGKTLNVKSNDPRRCACLPRDGSYDPP